MLSIFHLFLEVSTGWVQFLSYLSGNGWIDVFGWLVGWFLYILIAYKAFEKRGLYLLP